MFSKLFGRKSAAPRPSTEGRLIYAVGDVHGRLDLLRPLLTDIVADALRTGSGQAARGQRPLLVMLGDYVDRGPDSRGVVDLLIEMKGYERIETCVLKGNHEEALLQFLDDPAFGAAWLEHGAATTLTSYGVQPPASRTDVEAWGRARDAFAKALPASHLQFYAALDLLRIEGDYAFVHAGVRPGVALARQSEKDLLWIRYDFLNERGPFEKVIVHGHTPMEAPQITAHRLGLDTGAYATGVLTAIRLCGEDRQLMQVKAQRAA